MTCTTIWNQFALWDVPSYHMLFHSLSSPHWIIVTLWWNIFCRVTCQHCFPCTVFMWSIAPTVWQVPGEKWQTKIEMDNLHRGSCRIYGSLRKVHLSTDERRSQRKKLTAPTYHTAVALLSTITAASLSVWVIQSLLTLYFSISTDFNKE